MNCDALTGRVYLWVRIGGPEPGVPGNQFQADTFATDGYESEKARGVLTIDTSGSPSGDVGIVAVVPIGMCRLSGVNRLTSLAKNAARATSSATPLSVDPPSSFCSGRALTPGTTWTSLVPMVRFARTTAPRSQRLHRGRHSAPTADPASRGQCAGSPRPVIVQAGPVLGALSSVDIAI